MTAPSDLRDRVRTVLEAHWRPDGHGGGHTVPNATVYPWQWLWDSCFHAITWAELGEPGRAVAELVSALGDQAPDGFVPHMRYLDQPEFHADFWGRSATSSITQPPMYGHAIAELGRRGIAVPDELVDRAHRGLDFLLHDRARSDDGLVTVVHPWETGCDDSPRWDDWAGSPGGGAAWSVERWRAVKGELLATVERSAVGSPLANPAFAVAPAGFNALVAFNAAELGRHDDAAELASALDARWDGSLRTWVDGPHRSGRIRTVDALLPALVCDSHRSEALAEAVDDRAFGGACGPPAVHRAEPMFDPSAYWRGPAWPQLTYLLWRAGADVAGPLVAGARASGLAEYWHPDTGAGLGAIPQSWTGLALVVESAIRPA